MFKNLVWFDYHAATGPSVFLGVDVHVQDRGRGAEGGGLGESTKNSNLCEAKRNYAQPTVPYTLYLAAGQLI